MRVGELVQWAGQNSLELLGLLTTLSLLGVTYWYARTTKEMAVIAQAAASDSARATQAAERSAEAARDAAQVAQSRISVQFEGRTVALFTDGEHIPTVELRSIGDPVAIQSVRARRAFRVTPDGELHEQPAIVDELLTPVGETVLPARLHRGERIHLTHVEMNRPEKDRMGRFILDVGYTFGEAGGSGGTRQVIVSESQW